MKQLLCSMRGRLALVVCLASVMTVLVSENRASAQQGKYVSPTRPSQTGSAAQ